ncbi:MAG: hypothetical protein MUO27_08240 [Sedimentisphaerales bacterium]|nr:hypothetical protein [Sedimentisphaerales bacterium]
MVEKEEKIYWPAPGLVPDAELVIIGSAGRSAVGRTTAQDVIIAAAAGAEIVGGGITG